MRPYSQTSKKILLLDNFDSFTYILADYFLQLGANLTVLRNNVSLKEITNTRWDAIVLSPGPGKPEDSGVMPELIHRYHQQIPMLGICLGHQALGEYFGAELTHAISPMHGKISAVNIIQDPVFKGVPKQFDVVRYHSLVLKNIAYPLSPIAETAEGEVMGIAHQELPIYGFQFHPEAALTQHGLKLLGNWVNIYTLVS